MEQEVNGVAGAVKHFVSSQGGLLNETCSAVDKYMSDEVKKDVPTGIVIHMKHLGRALYRLERGDMYVSKCRNF